MSLIRQIWLLLAATVLLAFAGGVAVTADTTRNTLQDQLRLKNADNATALALVLSQQKGEPASMALLMSAQFDTGFFRSIRFVPAGGGTGFERRAQAEPLHAPQWFAELLPIESAPGVAQVSDGWRALGAVEVVSHVAYAHDELWRGTLRSALALALVGVLAALAAMPLVARIRRPLEQTVAQARSLERGEYVTVPEPAVPELQRLSRAMNSMVARIKVAFEGQAAQVEGLRRQAQCDPATGLANRAHFLSRFAAALAAEDHPAAGGLVLLRLSQLADLNRALGRETADRLILAVAQVLQEYAQRVPGCIAGRLNGSDFAVCLPAPGVAGETAQTLTNTLRAMLAAFGPQATLCAGAVELVAGPAMAQHLGAADEALARAESQGPFSVELVSPEQAQTGRLGEGAWRQRLHQAIVDGRLELGRFPVLAPAGQVLHFECPLRVQIDAAGAYEAAARWLPLALRARLTATLDERAAALALAEIRRDGQPRCVNIALASLADSGFPARLRALVGSHPREARSLWVEVTESAAAERFDLVQELGRQLRPAGVKLGLEHAGERLSRIERLFELGLDYVKLDATVGQGVGSDEARGAYLRGLVVLLRSLSLQIIVEGIHSDADANTLWACGVDGITGPWATARATPQA
jgi:EAL domain-containing protein (putative c-di-GMP-specific phosphodiesterase class I)/GGDEF domain-containing protein